MNFLRHSFSTITDPPPLPTLQDAAADREPNPGASLSAASAVSIPRSSTDSDGEDVRIGAADFLRTRNRVAIEDHVDVPADAGGIFIPCRELPKDWHLSGDITYLTALDRNFMFPGERLNIVVYVSSHDASRPEIITPFQVAALMEKAGSPQQNIDEFLKGQGDFKQTESADNTDCRLPFSETLLRLEGQKKRSAALLHLFQGSHFFTRFTLEEEQSLKKPAVPDLPSEASDEEKSSEIKSIQSPRPVPIVIEGGDFDPKIAGGVARTASCHLFDSGVIAVVLQVTVAVDLKAGAILEVLQFEQPWEPELHSNGKRRDDLTRLHSRSSSPSEQLLHWILPLDQPPPPPVPSMLNTPLSYVNSSPQRPLYSVSSGSTLFSFANLRTYSTNSSQSFQSSISSAPHHLSTYGSEEWDRPAAQRLSKGQTAGGEGLLSFRGTQLEPQRFSVHCGLEGLFVPGRRWTRKLEIVEPVAIESHFAYCNTRDLLCVHIENVVPDHLPEVLIMVDSISIICESAGPNSMPQSVPIACVEVGEDHRLPGLCLRPGEQHSFILKPSNSPFNGSVARGGASFSEPEYQDTKGSIGGKRWKVGPTSSLLQETGSYALIVSCRCNHTESRLHFKHPVQWQPRAPRDLLLSVSLEPAAVPEETKGSLPSLLPKIITVQATNLTSKNMHLTLLSPSSKNSSASLPFTISPGHRVPYMSNFMSFHERKEWPVTKTEDNHKAYEHERLNTEAPTARTASLQRSMSLPPVRPIESIMGITPRVVKERAISAADIAAENSSTRTHLWLQSTVPLGSVPPHSTTAVRCEFLPLTDGIITLDTLQIATKERDTIYTPEQCLQVYATSSIGIGLS